MMNKYYAGIGSRETPLDILRQMINIAKYLDKIGYTLRSGHADGADQIFGIGATKAEIWLPWKSFNSGKKVAHHVYKVIDPNDKEAYDSIKFHPAANTLKSSVCSLMARNFRQIIGRNNESNSEFVVCWTKDGKDTGGTGQALRIAAHYNIPIYNLYFSEKYDEIMSLY
jgi:hypothetical protein